MALQAQQRVHEAEDPKAIYMTKYARLNEQSEDCCQKSDTRKSRAPSAQELRQEGIPPCRLEKFQAPLLVVEG